MVNKRAFSFKIFLYAGLALFMGGCSQKVAVTTLEPAEIDRASKIKKVTVLDFVGDEAGLAQKIESRLSNEKVGGKNFFSVIERRGLKSIIEEQKLQSSSLVEPSEAIKLGNLTGAQAIISGNVGEVGASDTRYVGKRYKCLDKKCKEKSEYSVMCTKRSISLSAQVRMIDVERGDIIYADTIDRSAEWKHCLDDSNALPSVQSGVQVLSNKIAASFVAKLVPRYSTFEVTLLEDEDIDYGSKEEELLENSLEFIKQGRYDKAEMLLVELIDSTKQKSYVPFYDLGVIKEAQGEYAQAQEYYHRADALTKEPVAEINDAYNRIKTLIAKDEMAREQLLK